MIKTIVTYIVTAICTIAILACAFFYVKNNYIDSGENANANKELALKEDAATYPKTFDLRNVNGKNFVTPVKSQIPFGSCWAYASIAAVETSILSSLDLSYDEYKQKYGDGLDLSENQLAYFYTHSLENNERYPMQNGEGCHFEKGLDITAHPVCALSLMSSGVGPINEKTVPNHGKNGITTTFEKMPCYSKDDDWSVDESYRFENDGWEIKNCIYVPSVYKIDKGGSKTNKQEKSHYEEVNLKRAKAQLMAGKGLVICFCADDTSVYDSQNKRYGKYINYDNYAHYNYDQSIANHAVCIVGWDDTYSKDNFLTKAPKLDSQGNVVKDSNGNIVMEEVPRPDKDGAWIVKNSWGASKDSKYAVNYTDDLGNNFNINDWGVKDENGNNDGYFYLSYWDTSTSLSGFYSFDVEASDKKENNFIMQYDLMPFLVANIGEMPEKRFSNNKAYMANVFSNVKGQVIKEIGIQTCEPSTEVECKVYLLKKNYSDPMDGKEIYSFKKTYNYGGYYKYSIPKKDYLNIPAGKTYSVVVSQRANNNYIVIYKTIGKSSFCQDKSGNITAKATNNSVINKGESYIYNGENWIDMAEHKKEIEQELEKEKQVDQKCVVDNMPIKTYVKIK